LRGKQDCRREDLRAADQGVAVLRTRNSTRRLRALPSG
jgi:hypothetical protein